MNPVLNNTATCDTQYYLHLFYPAMSGRIYGYDSEDGFCTIQLYAGGSGTLKSARWNRWSSDNEWICVFLLPSYLPLSAGRKRKRAPPQSRLTQVRENLWRTWKLSGALCKHTKSTELSKRSFENKLAVWVETYEISVILILLADFPQPFIYYFFSVSLDKKKGCSFWLKWYNFKPANNGVPRQSR